MEPRVVAGASSDLALALIGQPGESRLDGKAGGLVGLRALIIVVARELVAQEIDDEPVDVSALASHPSSFERDLVSVPGGDRFQPKPVPSRGRTFPWLDLRGGL
jgi:hypothetical protein